MSKQTRNFILCLYVIALVLLVMGATYAYFTVIRVSTISPEIDAATATTDYISFDSGNEIYINPTSDNFKKDMNSLSSSTYSSAYVRRAEGDSAVTYKYNLYLEIEKNELVYSTTGRSPELLMQVVDPTGREVTSIEGLNYVTVTDNVGNVVKGFDVTDKNGKYYITKDYEITTMTEARHVWHTTMTFVNLDASQDGNLEKELKGYITIEKA